MKIREISGSVVEMLKATKLRQVLKALGITNMISGNKTNKIYQKTLVPILVFGLVLTQFSIVLASSITPEILVILTNQARLQYGAEILKINSQLTQAAQNKAQDMLNDDYFEHYSPDGKTPWDFILQSGYNYTIAGENLAMDFKTAEGIHNAWMNSPSHKKNIINDEYEDIGIATVKGEFDNHETTMVVQMFGKQMKKTNNIENLLWKINNWLRGF